MGVTQTRLKSADELGMVDQPPYRPWDVNVRVVGPVQVLSNGVDVRLGGPKQRTVFALLAADVGKPVAVKIWSGVQATSDPTIAAASAILIGLAVFTFASAAATQSLARRRNA